MAAADGPRMHDLLSEATRSLAETAGGDACSISRVIGDVLILVAEHGTHALGLPHGVGYLVSDYPETGRVLASGEPARVALADPACDPAEAAVLRELGFQALLMLPLRVDADAWGLVEIYRLEPRPFLPAEVAAAARATETLAARIARAIAADR